MKIQARDLQGLTGDISIYPLPIPHYFPSLAASTASPFYCFSSLFPIHQLIIPRKSLASCTVARGWVVLVVSLWWLDVSLVKFASIDGRDKGGGWLFFQGYIWPPSLPLLSCLAFLTTPQKSLKASGIFIATDFVSKNFGRFNPTTLFRFQILLQTWGFLEVCISELHFVVLFIMPSIA